MSSAKDKIKKFCESEAIVATGSVTGVIASIPVGLKAVEVAQKEAIAQNSTLFNKLYELTGTNNFDALKDYIFTHPQWHQDYQDLTNQFYPICDNITHNVFAGAFAPIVAFGAVTGGLVGYAIYSKYKNKKLEAEIQSYQKELKKKTEIIQSIEKNLPKEENVQKKDSDRNF